jgi:hypothetical protein
MDFCQVPYFEYLESQENLKSKRSTTSVKTQGSLHFREVSVSILMDSSVIGNQIIMDSSVILVVKETYYQLIAGNLYKLGVDGILRHWVLEHESLMILEGAHDGIVGVNYTEREMTHNILCAGLWCPMLQKYVKEYF